MRATISDMGPELLSRILGLTAAQEGVLNIVFRIADDKGLLLIDLKDLRILLNYVAEHKDDYLTTYGSISKQSVGGILRALLPLENQGGDLFFGEPDLDIYDWMRTDVYGKGIVNELRKTGAESHTVCQLPVMDDVRIIPEASRGGRSGKAEAGIFLR